MIDSREALTENLRALTSADQFAPSVGTSFRTSWGTEDSTSLELISAEACGKGKSRGSAREPFSLVFRAANAQYYLPQGVYLLEHEKHDKLPIFLVPIGPLQGGSGYQAIFT